MNSYGSSVFRPILPFASNHVGASDRTECDIKWMIRTRFRLSSVRFILLIFNKVKRDSRAEMRPPPKYYRNVV